MIAYFSNPIWRILLTFLSTIITAIVIATRRTSSVPLLNTETNGNSIYGKTAGLEFAGFFITFGISLIVGVLCGYLINGTLELIHRLE